MEYDGYSKRRVRVSDQTWYYDAGTCRWERIRYARQFSFVRLADYSTESPECQRFTKAMEG